MDEERAAHLDRVLIGGREPAEISVVDHDERWAVRFRGIAERLRQALGEDALQVREPAHPMVRTPARDVYEPDSQEARDHLDLRDWPRVDAADRELYAATKRALAGQQWSDMNDYADAKTEVVHAILARAQAWRAGALAPRAGS